MWAALGVMAALENRRLTGRGDFIQASLADVCLYMQYPHITMYGASPEVVRRRATSQKLDIFSFGVTAYETCAFALPWLRGTGKEAMTHSTEAPTDIRRYRPSIHPKLAIAITACLETNPAKRPESIEQFLRMIQGVEHEDA